MGIRKLQQPVELICITCHAATVNKRNIRVLVVQIVGILNDCDGILVRTGVVADILRAVTLPEVVHAPEFAVDEHQRRRGRHGIHTQPRRNALHIRIPETGQIAILPGVAQEQA